MSNDEYISQFLLLKRELQQRIPIYSIFAHIEKLLTSLTPLEFQDYFIYYVIKESSSSTFDSSLIKKLSAFLFAKFDKYYGGAKYALEDPFVEFFMTQSVASENGKCDRFFEISLDRQIHIKSSESLISEGTTGYSLWEASLALLALLSIPDYEYNLRTCFIDKRVLELGSGTGLGGLAVAALCHPQHVLLTDVTQVHDSYTSPNLLLNTNDIVGTNTNVQSRVLYWNDLIDDAESFSSQFDTILGCDLVYDPDVSAILSTALKHLFSASGSSVKQAVLLCTLRNPQTFADFVADLQKEPHFSVTVDELEGYDPQTNPIILQSIDSFRIIFINKQL